MHLSSYLLIPVLCAVTSAGAQETPKKGLELQVDKQQQGFAWIQDVEAPRLRPGVNLFMLYNVHNPTLSSEQFYTLESMRAVRRVAGDVASGLVSEYSSHIPFLPALEKGIDSVNETMGGVTPHMRWKLFGKEFDFDLDPELTLDFGAPMDLVGEVYWQRGGEHHRLLSFVMNQERVGVFCPLIRRNEGKGFDLDVSLSYDGGEPKRWEEWRTPGFKAYASFRMNHLRFGQSIRDGFRTLQ